MNLNITITRDESAVLRTLADAGKRILGPLARAWGSAAQETLGRAVRGRFTGKGPFPVSDHRLGVVTNRLRRSLRATAPQVNEADGTVSINMGSNVKYFGPHEFGFRGQVQVRGHTRRFSANTGRTSRGRLTKAATASAKGRIKSGRANYATVRPHSRRVNMPERRPLRTELESIQTRLTFRQKILAVIRNAMRRSTP